MKIGGLIAFGDFDNEESVR
jgi:hypothetical protein